jgi:hypothetical protein
MSLVSTGLHPQPQYADSLPAYTIGLMAFAMTEDEKEKAKAAAAAGVGAGVGTAGGASVGVLELAAQGAAVTGLSAGLVIGVGAVAGALLGLAGYGVYRNIKKRQKS